jgi:hypothetical protein
MKQRVKADLHRLKTGNGSVTRNSRRLVEMGENVQESYDCL